VRAQPRLVTVALALLSAVLLWLVLVRSVFGGFVDSSAITIDGTFTDWGTVASPTAGMLGATDYANNCTPDGSGISGAKDIVNLFHGLGTTLGGSTPTSDSNPLLYYYYRFDTAQTSSTLSQTYNVQLNLGVAAASKVDHLLQVYGAADGDSPETKIVLYSYDTPYPDAGAFTSGAITGLVS
jgi:adhesin/invasin